MATLIALQTRPQLKACLTRADEVMGGFIFKMKRNKLVLEVYNMIY